MKYAKPEIREVSVSIAAIKGTQKATVNPIEVGGSSTDYHFTPMAYEADE